MPPGAPTIGTATAGSGSASVGFTAPSYTGYPAGITSYTVTSSPGGFTGTGASSPITVSGLTNGTAYTFTVTATNATGTGPASAASNSVTPSVNYIEDVFSTYLYTGTAAALTITNNIDLSTQGGMVWLKVRSGTTGDHEVFDTLRGATNRLIPNATNAQITNANTLTAFNTNGFSVGNYSEINGSGNGMVSWTFRKQPKFFDVVTFTTPSTAGSFTVSHSLGAAPGFMAVKSVNTVDSWYCYHQSLGVNQYVRLDGTSAAVSSTGFFGTVGSTSITLNTSAWGTNVTYVMYLWANDAGGFGLTGTDNVISCGSYTGSGGTTTPLQVTLGYEPQWVMVKPSSGVGNWAIADTMRGSTSSSNGECLFNELQPNTTAAENAGNYGPCPTSNGFAVSGSGFPNASGTTYIYVAIRRGPMKVPTDATKVFLPYNTTIDAAAWYQSGFVSDFAIQRSKTANDGSYAMSRLTKTGYLKTETTAAETTSSAILWGSNTSAVYSSAGYGLYQFQRAPSFFDEVCYTGTGANRNVTHNLGVAPELMWIKCRSGGNNWRAYSAGIGATKTLYLNSNDASTTDAAAWNNTAPTSSVFTVGTSIDTNDTGQTYVAYLFATCAGVSKVGSYTGTGATQTIACGFAGGARFVMIKRTDTTGDWYYWDTARGMVAGTDPSLLFNTAAAQVNANSVYTTTGGFQIVSTAAGINASGGTYIYLAIA